MTAVIFVGPTLTSEAVSECLDATILPPVRQGDVYRVAQGKPDAIGIIDGFFEGVPSVWHKEILWAMEMGIPVFGSASMGALRAAELADFGMIGVGRIFEDYYNGVLQDDDEVAVLHSPAELGFLPLSEPMVSVRATVDQAVTNGVLPAEAAAQVLQCAKAMNYRDRVWSAITDEMIDVPGMEAFRDWLPDGRVDAKAEDGRAMLQCMSEHLDGSPLPPSASVRTERTLMWKGLRARVDGSQADGNKAVIDELRLNPELYARLRDRAVLVLLSQEDAIRKDREPDRAELVKQMADHRARTGLPRRSDLMEWLEANDLSPEGYEGMLAETARVEAAAHARAKQLEAAILSELRRTDQYTGLRDRAAIKARTTAGNGATGADRLRTLMWYFETHLDQDVPDDLESYAVSLGLADRDAFYDLIEAEFLFCQSGSDPEGPTA